MSYTGEIAALATAFFWSMSSLFFAQATRRAGFFRVNVSRLMAAAAILGFIIFAGQLEARISYSQLFFLSASGVAGLSLGDSFLFRAYAEIGPRLTMVIMSIAPALAALLGFIFLGEKLSFWVTAGMAVTIAGILTVTLEQRTSQPNGSGSELPARNKAGFVFAILAAFGQATALVLSKVAFREGIMNGFVAAEIRIVASLVFLLPIFLFTPLLKETVSVFDRDRKALFFMLAGTISGPVAGISLSLISVMYTGVGIAATLMATVPVMMLPLMRIFYGEIFSLRAVLGAFIAVSGVALLFVE